MYLALGNDESALGDRYSMQSVDHDGSVQTLRQRLKILSWLR